MTDRAAALPARLLIFSAPELQRGTLVALAVLLAVVAVLILISPNHLTYFDVSTISASATTLALAGIGETIVVLAGGLDLSPGAVISLVNVVLVTLLGPADLSTPVYTAAAVGIALGLGTAIGAVNGILVGYFRL